MTQLLMKRKEEGKKGRREKKKRKRKRKGKEKRRGKKNPNFTLSGSPGACGFSLLTLKRKRRREKGGKRRRGKKKKKKKNNNASKKIPFPNFTLSGSPGAFEFSLYVSQTLGVWKRAIYT